MLLVNASKNAVAYKKELQLARSQNVDVTNFENKLQETDLHTMKPARRPMAILPGTKNHNSFLLGFWKSGRKPYNSFGKVEKCA